MTDELQIIALDSFFNFYRSDVEAEVIDAHNVVLSFPVHFSGFHRVEVTLTQVNANTFLISDGAKIISELRAAGYVVNKKLRDRLEMISSAAKIRVVKNHLISNCSLADLGSSLQRFLEAAKTIGDAYLVQRLPLIRDNGLVDQVSSFLLNQRVLFQTKHPLSGEYENHTVDFYFSPNGVPGLALSVINSTSRTTAEAWAFRASDIKRTNERTKVGVVYDDAEIRDNSRSILEGVLDVSIPSSNIPALQASLRSIGILKN